MKKKKARIVSVLLMLTMMITLISGCGKDGQSENTNATAQNDATNMVTEVSSGDGQQSQSTEPVAMGRYVENVTDMSDKINGSDNDLYMLEDGTLILTEEGSCPFYISKDNGESWTEDDWAWHKELMDKKDYVAETAIGADGTVAVIYDDSGEDEYEPELHVIKPDGSETMVTPPDADANPRSIAVTDDGRVFVCYSGREHLYEVKEDGSCELFLTIQQYRPDFLNTKGKLLIMDGYDYGAPLIYDLEKDEYVEDEVLKDFCSENYSGGNSYGSAWMEVYFFPGEEGVIYIAGKKGLHRHVIGGSAVEQVIDGNLCTFANPAYGIGGMLMLPDNEFMTIFSGTRLVRFVYDKDVPTVPNERLKVYSLKDNDAIRQGISSYQTANPEVYVEYEVGMGDNDSITREDALKSLNTKIMAGEGPDVLILDNMPLNSYIEKGLLMDLSGLVNGLSGEDELFGNIVDAMKTDDKLYVLPCEIQIPVMLGEGKYMSMVKDLSGIADMMEATRRDYPEEDLLNICSERGIMRYFGMTSAPAWITKNNEIDKTAVTEYLKQTKRIYDAQLDGLPEETIDLYRTGEENWREQLGEERTDSKYFRMGTHGINYIGGYTKMVSGTLYGRDSYSNMISVKKVEGYEDSEWTLMNGQCKNVFCANTLMGINAASQFTSQAQDFIKLCLSKESQSSMYDGLMINKASFDETFAVDTDRVDETGVYLSEGVGTQDGVSVHYLMYWPDEKQTAELKSCIESLDTPYIENTVIEDAVYDEGGAYFRGEKSLEDAVNAIEKKIALYLAE